MFSFLKPKPAADGDATVDDAVVDAGGWFRRLKEGLSKTRRQLGGQLAGLFGVGRKLDEAFYDELETVLLSADVGVAATGLLIDPPATASPC